MGLGRQDRLRRDRRGSQDQAPRIVLLSVRAVDRSAMPMAAAAGRYAYRSGDPRRLGAIRLHHARRPRGEIREVRETVLELQAGRVLEQEETAEAVLQQADRLQERETVLPDLPPLLVPADAPGSPASRRPAALQGPKAHYR